MYVCIAKVKIVKLKHLHTCVQKIQHEGCVEMLMQCEVKPSIVSECCVFCTHKQGGALSVILYFLVVWLGAIFSSTQTAAIFSDQDITGLFS